MELSRRLFMKGALGVAAAGLAGASAVPALKALLPPPVTRCDPDAAHDTLVYRAQPGGWWNARDGQEARAEHFDFNQGAFVLWAPAEAEAELGSCEISLTVVKLQADELLLAVDGAIDTGDGGVLLAFHTNKCPHLCCKPAYQERGQGLSGEFTNSLFCACHQSRFDPYSIVEDSDEQGRKVMVAELKEGPAPYGLPMVPLAEREGVLVGRTDKLEWLKYCGQG